MLTDNEFALPTLSKWHRSKLLGHAQKILAAQQQLVTNSGKNILHYTLKKQRRHTKLQHYPKGDRTDHQTGAQYFYHCHRENMDNEEHGHFHCFLRYKHIPKNRKPTPLTDWDKYMKNPIAHLVAVAMNRYGQPIRLFTVNRWVTSEIWYDAHHIPCFLKKFKMTLADDPYWQILDQWIEGMIQLFSPQITWLHHQRDLIMQKHILDNPNTNVYEDRSFEELSEISIDLKTQIQWLIYP